jgi:hypothetical protein
LPYWGKKLPLDGEKSPSLELSNQELPNNLPIGPITLMFGYSERFFVELEKQIVSNFASYDWCKPGGYIDRG